MWFTLLHRFVILTCYDCIIWILSKYSCEYEDIFLIENPLFLFHFYNAMLHTLLSTFICHAYIRLKCKLDCLIFLHVTMLHIYSVVFSICLSFCYLRFKGDIKGYVSHYLHCLQCLEIFHIAKSMGKKYCMYKIGHY